MSLATAAPSPTTIPRRALILLIILTLVWGSNWPVMKMGVSGYPPLTFRTWCLMLGWPVLGLVLWRMKVSFYVPKAQWRELFSLSFFNMFVWYGLAKAGEIFDQPIYALTGFVSGHTLKHLCAGLAVYWVLRSLRLRQPSARVI